MTMYEPMDVEYVETEHGAHPEPPLNSEWPRIDVLRWFAGLIRSRTGVVVRFSDQHSASGPGYDVKWPELVGVHLVHPHWASSQSMDDSEVWTFLRGVQAGAEAVNRNVKV